MRLVLYLMCPVIISTYVFCYEVIGFQLIFLHLQLPLFPEVNVLTSMELGTLYVCSTSISEAQKMVHMYPANPCYLGALVYLLGDCSCELKEKYKAVVLLCGKCLANSVRLCDVYLL